MRRISEEGSDTFKCPTCGTKVLVNTGYCLKCKKKVKPPKGSEKPEKKDDKDEKKKDDKDEKKKEGMIAALKTGIKEEREVIGTFEILEDVKISQTNKNIILEKGDKIEVFRD